MKSAKRIGNTVGGEGEVGMYSEALANVQISSSRPDDLATADGWDSYGAAIFAIPYSERSRKVLYCTMCKTVPTLRVKRECRRSRTCPPKVLESCFSATTEYDVARTGAQNG